MITKRGFSKRIVNKTVDRGQYGTYSYAKDKDSILLFRKRSNKITGGVTYTLIPEAWDNFIKKIENNPELTPAKKTTMINEANRIKNDILTSETKAESKKGAKLLYASERQFGWNRIDEKSMLSRMKASQHEKLFANLGLSPDELAEYLGVSVNDVLDETKWTDNLFKTDDGKIFEVTFGYDLTSAFRRIQ